MHVLSQVDVAMTVSLLVSLLVEFSLRVGNVGNSKRKMLSVPWLID